MHLIWHSVKRVVEALCVVWICDSMSKRLSLKVVGGDLNNNLTYTIGLKELSKLQWHNASAKNMLCVPEHDV